MTAHRLLRLVEDDRLSRNWNSAACAGDRPSTARRGWLPVRRAASSDGFDLRPVDDRHTQKAGFLIDVIGDHFPETGRPFALCSADSPSSRASSSLARQYGVGDNFSGRPRRNLPRASAANSSTWRTGPAQDHDQRDVELAFANIRACLQLTRERIEIGRRTFGVSDTRGIAESAKV